MTEVAVRIPYTAERILKDFNRGKMSVNIKGASMDEMTKFKELTLAKYWRSGDEFDSSRLYYYYNYAKYNAYVVYSPSDGGNGFVTKSTTPYTDYSMGIKDFLAMFNDKVKVIEEHEIEEILNE